MLIINSMILWRRRRAQNRKNRTKADSIPLRLKTFQKRAPVANWHGTSFNPLSKKGFAYNLMYFKMDLKPPLLIST